MHYSECYNVLATNTLCSHERMMEQQNDAIAIELANKVSALKNVCGPYLLLTRHWHGVRKGKIDSCTLYSIWLARHSCSLELLPSRSPPMCTAELTCTSICLSPLLFGSLRFFPETQVSAGMFLRTLIDICHCVRLSPPHFLVPICQ
jgi:hypothetical protein